MYFGNTLEKSLHTGAGILRQHFKPDRTIRPLGKDEFRYRVEVADSMTGVLTMRSCVCNRTTKERRFELPDKIIDGVLQDASAHLVLDRGSVGKEHSTFLLKKIGLRCTQTFDLFHMLQSNLDIVFTLCDSDFAKKEACVAYNAGHAPYGTGQWPHGGTT